MAFGPGVPAALLHAKADLKKVGRWSTYNIELSEGYKAALVVEGKKHRLKRVNWDRASAALAQDFDSGVDRSKRSPSGIFTPKRVTATLSTRNNHGDRFHNRVPSILS